MVKRTLKIGDIFTHISKLPPHETYKYMYCGKVGNERLLYSFEDLECFTVDEQWIKQRAININCSRKDKNIKLAKYKKENYIWRSNKCG